MLVFPAAPRYSKSRRTQTENLTGVFAVEIPLQEFERAAQRLKGVLHHTELDLSATFSAMTGGNIYLKYENSQKTGSFKIRGASNKIAALVERGETGAVVASSAGNHAQGVAYAAHRFGIPATIVMPKTAPIAKAKATEGYGATVVLAGDCYDEAYAKACEMSEQEHAPFRPPYNAPEGVAGPGSRCQQIFDPSGAAPVAAVLKGKGDVKGKNVVCLLSGGNIDVSFIQCIIEQGLVSRHRRLRFTVTLLDRPGSLGKLLNDIAALGANILSVEHDRLTAGLNPNEIDVHVSCEVGGKEHGDRVLDQLIQTGYHVKID